MTDSFSSDIEWRYEGVHGDGAVQAELIGSDGSRFWINMPIDCARALYNGLFSVFGPVVDPPEETDEDPPGCAFCGYQRPDLPLTDHTRQMFGGRTETVELCEFCATSASAEAWLAGIPLDHGYRAATDAAQYANALADLIRGRTR